MNLITIVIGAKIIQQLLYNLYLFQLKEYRFDRLQEHLLRVYKNYLFALFHLTLLAPIKLPRLTIKSFLIFFINLLPISLIGFFNNLSLLLISFFFTPIFLYLNYLIFLFPAEKIIRIVIYRLLAKKIKEHQQKYNLKVIGITGSFGKSTTKYFLNQTLSTKYRTLAPPESINTPLGISLFLLKNLKKEHQILIIEMGAYKKGEIKEICQIVHPQIGIITGISNQHLALFGSQKNIIEAKSELLFSLPNNALVLINKSSPYLPIIPKEKKLKLLFYEQSFLKKYNDLINQPQFLSINLVPSIILAEYFRISHQQLISLINKIQPPPKTMKQISGYKGSLIIDDSFNSNFDGVLAALDFLKKFRQKKILIMPCIIELGNQSQIIHQKIGQKIKESIDVAIITSSDYFDSIKKEVWGSKEILLITNPNKVIKKLETILDEETVVLLEGKVHAKIHDFLLNLHYKKTITIGLSPNLEKDDYLLTLKIFFKPSLFSRNNYLTQLENLIKRKFGFKYVFLTDSGRSAFYLLLKSLNWPKNSQIAIQGFTCNAAVNPILWAGLKPVYIDIDDSWNLDSKDLDRHINPKLKGVVVQHSFGFSANLEPIKAVCQKNQLFLIEDLALSLGTKFENKYCGNFSDAAILSFGRDKVVSSVFGGALITNNDLVANKIKVVYGKLPNPNFLWVYQQLFHPIITFHLKHFFHLKLARLLLWFFQKISLISLPIRKEEYKASKPSFYPKKMPNHLAALAINQLNKIDHLNNHRKKIAAIYQKILGPCSQKIFEGSQPIFLRYNIISRKTNSVIQNLRKQRIFLGNWYSQPIDPKGTDLKKFYYQKGLYPHAEKIAGNIINLPTHINISINDAYYLANKIKSLIKNEKYYSNQ